MCGMVVIFCEFVWDFCREECYIDGGVFSWGDSVYCVIYGGFFWVIRFGAVWSRSVRSSPLMRLCTLMVAPWFIVEGLFNCLQVKSVAVDIQTLVYDRMEAVQVPSFGSAQVTPVVVG